MNAPVKTMVKLTSDQAFLDRWDDMLARYGWSRAGFIREAVDRIEQLEQLQTLERNTPTLAAINQYAPNIQARAERRGETEAEVVATALQFYFRHYS